MILVLHLFTSQSKNMFWIISILYCFMSEYVVQHDQFSMWLQEEFLFCWVLDSTALIACHIHKFVMISWIWKGSKMGVLQRLEEESYNIIIISKISLEYFCKNKSFLMRLKDDGNYENMWSWFIIKIILIVIWVVYYRGSKEILLEE